MKTKNIEVVTSLSEDSIKAILIENGLESSDINIATLIGLLRNSDTAQALNEDLKSVLEDACNEVLDSHGEQFDGADAAGDDSMDDSYNDSYDDSYNESYDDSMDDDSSDSDDDEGYF